MNDNNAVPENTAQTVVFLEVLARVVEKSPMAYSEDAAKDLAAHVRGMAHAVNTDASVDPHVLHVTRQDAALDWHNELVAVMFAREHRPSFS